MIFYINTPLINRHHNGIVLGIYRRNKMFSQNGLINLMELGQFLNPKGASLEDREFSGRSRFRG